MREVEGVATDAGSLPISPMQNVPASFARVAMQGILATKT